MIAVLLWCEDMSGTLIESIKLSIENIEVDAKRLNYKSSRTIKGRKSQDWYSTYNTFSMSVRTLKEEEFQKLERILVNQSSILKISYGGQYYEVVFESDSFKYKKEWSGYLGGYIYKDISIDMEESNAKSVNDSQLLFVPHDENQRDDEQHLNTDSSGFAYCYIIKSKNQEVGSVEMIPDTGGSGLYYDTDAFYDNRVLRIIFNKADYSGIETAMIVVKSSSGSVIRKIQYEII